MPLLSLFSRLVVWVICRMLFVSFYSANVKSNPPFLPVAISYIGFHFWRQKCSLFSFRIGWFQYRTRTVSVNWWNFITLISSYWDKVPICFPGWKTNQQGRVTEDRENTCSICSECSSLKWSFSDTFLYILMPWLWERQKCLYDVCNISVNYLYSWPVSSFFIWAGITNTEFLEEVS